MMNIILALKKIKHILNRYRFCYIKTVIVNFRLLPFKQAIHLPFVVYGPLQLNISNAKILLNVKPTFGLIKWGYNVDFFVPSKAPSMLMMINGTININGPVRISSGCVFRISGNLNLGSCCRIGGGSKILCNNYVTIGDYSALAFGTIVCDTNFHYIQYERSVKNCDGTVLIGNLVFIGNNSSIVKGAKLPDYTIVSSKSYVNKDFLDSKKGILLVGAPARIIREGCFRIFSQKLENKIRCYFATNNNVDYLMPDNENDSPEDLLEVFR